MGERNVGADHDLVEVPEDAALGERPFGQMGHEGRGDADDEMAPIAVAIADRRGKSDERILEEIGQDLPGRRSMAATCR